MYHQAIVLGETEEALAIRLKQLTPPQRTTEEERRLYFMRGIMPKGWTLEALNFVETVVPPTLKAGSEEIELSSYAALGEIHERMQAALANGYHKTHQGLLNDEGDQLDLSIPVDAPEYIAEARRQLAEQAIPLRRVFYHAQKQRHFLLWELMRSPDMDPSAPLITEIVLLLPHCIGELQVSEVKPKRLPPSAETFAYHQIFVMLERLYSEWPNQEGLLQEIAMQVLTLRDLEARRLPRAFCLLDQLGA